MENVDMLGENGLRIVRRKRKSRINSGPQAKQKQQWRKEIGQQGQTPVRRLILILILMVFSEKTPQT